MEVGMTASAPIMTHEEFSKGSILSVFFDSVYLILSYLVFTLIKLKYFILILKRYSVPQKWVGRGVDSESNPFNCIIFIIIIIVCYD